MIDDTRPKPASFGFDIDFDDLSAAKPASIVRPAKAAPAPPKPAAIKTSEQGSAPRAATPTSAPLKKPKPKAAKKPKVLQERQDMADKLAKSMGFQSREQQPQLLKKRRRTHHDEPVDQLSIRGPVRVLNEFITYCETEHLSYWEAMERLLQK